MVWKDSGLGGFRVTATTHIFHNLMGRMAAESIGGQSLHAWKCVARNLSPLPSLELPVDARRLWKQSLGRHIDAQR